MVARTVAVASFFLIRHISINSFSVIRYFFSPDNTQHILNPPYKPLERYHGSCEGEMDVIIELTLTSHVPIEGFSTVVSSGVLMLLLMFS